MPLSQCPLVVARAGWEATLCLPLYHLPLGGEGLGMLRAQLALPSSSGPPPCPVARHFQDQDTGKWCCRDKFPRKQCRWHTRPPQRSPCQGRTRGST